MTSMFKCVTDLLILDLSSFDMSNVTSKSNMLSDTNSVSVAYARSAADALDLNNGTGKPSSYKFVVKP